MTNNPRRQKRYLKVFAPEFSHEEYLPLEIKVSRPEVGWRIWRWFCRSVQVRTLEEVWYRDANQEIVIPAGTESDLGSIPTVAWAIVSPWDIALESLFHDQGFRLQPHGILRVVHDATLFSMMAHRKNPQWVCWLVYLLVRAFGGRAWNDNAKRNKRLKRVFDAANADDDAQ